MFVAKTRRNFESTKWCILCTPKPDLTTCTSRQRNRAKPTRNLVLGLKKWIGHVRCENKTQHRMDKAVHCIHPKSRSHNRYLPVTESRETTQNLVLGLEKWIGHVRCRKQDATSEAQSGAFYAPQNPISQLVPPGNGIARNHPET